jgi:hypothetical protein
MLSPPTEVQALSQALYNHRKTDPTLPVTLRDLGWTKVRTVPVSGAWWVEKGNLQALVIFGGPHLDAKVHDWKHKDPV